MIILVPEPEDPVAAMAGLGKEIWEGIDVEEYIRGERESWEDSPTN